MIAAASFKCDSCGALVKAGDIFIRYWWSEEMRWAHKHIQCPPIEDRWLDEKDRAFLKEIGIKE